MKEAMYWEKLEQDDKVRCLLCPHTCKISPGNTGICVNKKNEGGSLYAHHYGEISALGMDPIEKKPLYHFCPGRMILSVGTVGCNLGCDFCQNFHLVRAEVPTDNAAPEDIVNAAIRKNSFGIAYTYNEPFISYEFVLDCCKKAREEGLKNVLVTNGFYNPKPFEELLPYVDAMNIDLKAIRDDFYKNLCNGRLGPVKKTIERAVESPCHVELTTLIITGENDSDEDLAELVDYVASLDPNIPLHFSAYRPMYKRDNPPTSRARLEKAYELGTAKLNYVYLGNVIMEKGQDSICPHCGAVLVDRSGYTTRIENLAGESCKSCGNAVSFVNE
jgi:pyruvate formate lyase activating enzyme